MFTAASAKEIRDIEQEIRENQLAKYGKIGGAKKSTVTSTVKKRQEACEAVHEKTHKDTDNFLVTVC
jgi:hypothetical protein